MYFFRFSKGTVASALAYAADDLCLISLVSLLSLFVASMMAISLMGRRYFEKEGHLDLPLLLLLSFFFATTVGFAVAFQISHKWGMVGTGIAAFLEVVLFTLLEQQIPSTWHVLFVPWTPCLALFLNVLLASSLETRSIKWFSIIIGTSTLSYLFFSMHNSYDQLQKDRTLP